jgi:hypothetical protein
LFLVYQACPPCKRRMIGAIARIAEMIAGVANDNGIAETVVTIPMGITAGTSRKVIATGWIEDGKMRGVAGRPIRTTPAISEMATLPIAKASAEGMRKGTARIITPVDGNQQIALTIKHHGIQGR